VVLREDTNISEDLHGEHGGNKDLRNFGILPQHHTATQPRRPRLVPYPSENKCRTERTLGTNLKKNTEKVAMTPTVVMDSVPYDKICEHFSGIDVYIYVSLLVIIHDNYLISFELCC
jgi:hypothetical protein